MNLDRWFEGFLQDMQLVPSSVVTEAPGICGESEWLITQIIPTTNSSGSRDRMEGLQIW